MSWSDVAPPEGTVTPHPLTVAGVPLAGHTRGSRPNGNAIVRTLPRRSIGFANVITPTSLAKVRASKDGCATALATGDSWAEVRSLVLLMPDHTRRSLADIPAKQCAAVTTTVGDTNDPEHCETPRITINTCQGD
jgi:hypothetical protein